MREIHLLAVSIVNNLNRVFEYCHHAQPEQINFDDAEIGAIVLIPLHNHASRHSGRFEWNDAIELALANDHASRMLPKVPRQIENLARERKKFQRSGIAQIETLIDETAFQRVFRILPLEWIDLAGKLRNLLFIESKHLADIPYR